MREPTDQEILDILQEECAEVIQVISKARRFGMTKSRVIELRQELVDVLAMAEWLQDRNVISLTGDVHLLAKAIQAKQEKVKKYLR